MNRILSLRLWLLERLKPGSMHNTLWLAALIGFLGSLTTVFFSELLELGGRLLFGHTQGLVKAASLLPWWKRILIPTLGGIIAGWILKWSSRFKSEQATDYMEAITLKEGSMNVRESLVRVLSSIVSIGSGSSIGREGSMVQLSAMVGLGLAFWTKVPSTTRRLFIACGGAAGITAAYNAPIAGALFISEIVFHSIAVESLGPLIVASVISNLTVHSFLGYRPVYHMPHFSLMYNSELILHALLGVCMGLIAPSFLGLLDASKRFFKKAIPSLPVRLGLGGAIVGVISLVHPQVWGNGYSVVNDILANEWAWAPLLLLIVTKVGATAATVGSGAVGGIFTPTLFVGAAFGFIFGEGVHHIWPTLAPSAVYAAIGMAAFLSGTIHAPLTAMLMIFEMTGQYQMMLPVMLASVLAYFTSRLQRTGSLYSSSVKSASSKNFSELTVQNILHKDPPTASIQASLEEFEQQFISYRWQHVYVINEHHQFLGAVSLHDLRPLFQDRNQLQDTLPAGLLKKDYPRATPAMTLGHTLEMFARHPGERIPVVDEHGYLVGFISKTDIMLLLQESIAE